MTAQQPPQGTGTKSTDLPCPCLVQKRGRADGGCAPPSPQSSSGSWRRSSTSPTTLTSMSATSWLPGSTSRKPGCRYGHLHSAPSPKTLGTAAGCPAPWALWGFPNMFHWLNPRSVALLAQVLLSQACGHKVAPLQVEMGQGSVKILPPCSVPSSLRHQSIPHTAPLTQQVFAI